ncbi:sperm acrosome membrane-associated protein 4-like [Antechinus flavipes]|uniref:sperm acrosome membrane-associated protein 4-like n=1 Tax=Antechinus flavipes TaxID=38775 RepID=UPI002235B419|nr:sperm acrosome membrane-associated protein 4-like [Antechinus flavipes]
MGCRQFLFLGLLFTAILSPLVVAKNCYYCDLTNTPNCMGIPMYCGKEEDCYQGRGVASGISYIINKGCVEATNCGKEQLVEYMGVTYNFITYCCSGELCNAGSPGPSHIGLGPNIVVVSMALALLFYWLF